MHVVHVVRLYHDVALGVLCRGRVSTSPELKSRDWEVIAASYQSLFTWTSGFRAVERKVYLQLRE